MSRISLSSLPVVLAGILFAACAPAAAPAVVPAAPSLSESPLPATAAAAADTMLSLRRIMEGEAFVGTWPSQIVWAPDSRAVYFRWSEPESGDTITSIFRTDLDGTVERIEEEDVPPLPRFARWTHDRSRVAFTEAGDVYVADRDGRTWRVTESATSFQDAHLSGRGDLVYFRSGGALYEARPETGRARQILELRTEDEPSDDPDDRERFLREREREIFDAIREREAQREAAERRDSLRRVAPRVHLGRGTRVTGTRVSPSGRYVLVSVGSSGNTESTMVPEFVTETGYARPINARPKVGDVGPPSRLALVDLEDGGLEWVSEREENRMFSVTEWSPADDELLLLSISSDYTDRWIETLRPGEGARQIHHLHDAAWIGGPSFTSAGWLPNGRTVYFVSEETGYAHLYTSPARGGTVRALTEGRWEVHDIQLEPTRGTFLLTTNRPHPGTRVVERLPFEGGALEPVVDWHGWTTQVLSPDGERMALLHSRADSPPELFLLPVSGGQALQVTRSATGAFAEGPWIRPEVLAVPAQDGRDIYARIYRPEEVGAERNGAAVIFVHGAGYLQNAHYGWSTYYREYMFHHLLAQRGYVVLDMDFRASEGYGRDWRTGIHEHMGGLDLSDNVDGARWLVREEGVDPARIGIYGGSYGGFITLMALFTEPDVFAAGAALRSVTDWAHYNHWYTSRILGTPQENPEAYLRSSPIHFAEGLEGHLLITHGMVDTNVQFQDVVRLSQRLIELGKENWEMAVYPVEPHAFRRADSWADQYRRILELFERTIGE